MPRRVLLNNLHAWAAEQLGVEATQGEGLVQQASRLVGSLLAGDTRLFERMRQTIQKKASVRIEAQPEPSAKAKNDKDATPAAGDAAADAQAEAHDHDGDAEGWSHDDDLVGDEAEHHEETTAEGASQSSHRGASRRRSTTTAEAATIEATGEASATPSSTETAAGAEPPISLSFETKKNREAKLTGGKRKGGDKAAPRRRPSSRHDKDAAAGWGCVLQPLRSLKKPIQRLTSYQL